MIQCIRRKDSLFRDFTAAYKVVSSCSNKVVDASLGCQVSISKRYCVSACWLLGCLMQVPFRIVAAAIEVAGKLLCLSCLAYKISSGVRHLGVCVASIFGVGINKQHLFELVNGLLASYMFVGSNSPVGYLDDDFIKHQHVLQEIFLELKKSAYSSITEQQCQEILNSLSARVEQVDSCDHSFTRLFCVT